MNEQNNVRSTLEGFRDKLQERIKARISRPSIADTLQEQNKQQVEKKSPWFAEVKTDKATYTFMAVSAVFTALLGLILGLAPERQTALDGSTSIYFHTDLLHWIIAIVYVVAFVAVTEVAFLIAKNKYHTREEGNMAQQNTMLIMMGLSIVSIIGTGYAGGVIGASVLGFLTEFRDIPANAQEWVVKIVPVLIALYGGLLTVYKLSSDEERDNRLTDQLERKQRREHKLNRKLAELEVDEMMALAEDKAWIEAVERGALTAGEASAAKKAGKTLRQLEREKGDDLDGDGTIGTTKSRTRPAAPPSQDYGPEWKNSTDISTTLDDYAWVCLGCAGHNRPHTRRCQWCGDVRTNGSPVSAFGDLPPTGNDAPAPTGSKRPLYNEHTYHPVPMDPRERKNGQNFE